MLGLSKQFKRALSCRRTQNSPLHCAALLLSQRLPHTNFFAFFLCCVFAMVVDDAGSSRVPEIARLAQINTLLNKKEVRAVFESYSASKHRLEQLRAKVAVVDGPTARPQIT